MRTTECECFDALRTAADELGESPTKRQYERLGLTPAASTILRVVGGWNEAKRRAGLETYASSGSRVQPKPDDVEVSADEAWGDLTQDQRWYYKNRKADNRYELDRRQRLRATIHESKDASDGCRRCDETDPACLDFHHVDGADKEMAVNDMVTYGYSKADIRAEMDDCVVLCANCHFEQHVDLPDIGTETPSSKRERLQHWSVAYRRGRQCRRCCEDRTACLQFHHPDTDRKVASISTMISDGYPEEAVRSEAEKCVVLCANCHRKEHYVEPNPDGKR